MNSAGDIPRFMARHQDKVLEILQSITAAEEVPQLGDHQGDPQLGDPQELPHLGGVQRVPVLGDPQEDYQPGPANKA